MTPGDTDDVLKPILDKALAGELDAKAVDLMLAAAATQQQIAEFRRDLRRIAEPAVVRRFHKALKDGCADEVLDSLRRPVFDEAAQGLARAKAAGINAESDPAHILSTGNSDTAAAWQDLPKHLAVVSRIGMITGISAVGRRRNSRRSASTPAPRTSGSKIPRCCAAPGIWSPSAMFARPDPIGHRTSPWARAILRLNTIDEARARYNGFAAAEFDRVNDRALGGWVDEQGQVHPHPKPENPYRRETEMAS